jgi:acetyl-CoA acetyltransferase
LSASGETAQTASSGRDPIAMAAEAIAVALDDAGLQPEDVDGLMFRGGMADQFTAAAFQQYFGTTRTLWVCSEGGAMSWAGTAPYEAAMALRHGSASVIVNAFTVNWATQAKSGSGGGPGAYHREEALKANLELPFGFYPQPVYFAMMAQRHMYQYGTTAAQLGAIAVTSRSHASTHPGAVMRDKTLTLDEYLATPPFIDPLRVPDCCLISDGAAAYVMTSREQARALRETACERARACRGNGCGWHIFRPASPFYNNSTVLQCAGRLSHGRNYAGGCRRASDLRPLHDRGADAD